MASLAQAPWEWKAINGDVPQLVAPMIVGGGVYITLATEPMLVAPYIPSRPFPRYQKTRFTKGGRDPAHPSPEKPSLASASHITGVVGVGRVSPQLPLAFQGTGRPPSSSPSSPHPTPPPVRGGGSSPPWPRAGRPQRSEGGDPSAALSPGRLLSSPTSSTGGGSPFLLPDFGPAWRVTSARRWARQH